MTCTADYTSQSISGYNSSPPPDDGSQVASNQLEWAKHITKIGNPLKTLIEAINTELVTTFTEVCVDIVALQDHIAFPDGSGVVSIPFYLDEEALPTGWTSLSLNNMMMKVRNVGGGVTGGTNSFSSQFSATLASESTTLSVADTPAHTHFMAAAVDPGTESSLSNTTQAARSNITVGDSEDKYNLQPTATAATVGLTSSYGSGGGHTHDVDMDAEYAEVIMGTRYF